MTKIKNTKKIDKAIIALLKAQLDIDKISAKRLLDDAFNWIDGKKATPAEVVETAVDWYWGSDASLGRVRPTSLFAFRPSVEQITETVHYESIQDIPTDEVFDMLATRNQDDTTGDLLDELERRFNPPHKSMLDEVKKRSTSESVSPSN